MRIVLLQTKQNALYDFTNPARYHALEGARQLQRESIDDTLSLLGDIDTPCDLIVTPEAVNFPGSPECVTDDWRKLLNRDVMDAFGEHARRLGAYLVLGAYTRRGATVYNSALVFDRGGRQIACYDKVHLAGGERQALAAGREYVCVDADFGCFGVCICWDMQFPEVCRILTLQGARLVVCPTWGWEGVYAHARAYENGIFVAGAMAVPYQGPIEGIRNPSEVVSPFGEVLAVAPRDRKAVLACELQLSDSDAPHALRLGNRRPDTYQHLLRKSECP